jgi:hypothetical protein
LTRRFAPRPSGAPAASKPTASVCRVRPIDGGRPARRPAGACGVQNRSRRFCRPLWHLSSIPHFRLVRHPTGVVHRSDAAVRGRDCTHLAQTLTAWTTTKTVKSVDSAGPATAQRGETLPARTVKR